MTQRNVRRGTAGSSAWGDAVQSALEDVLAENSAAGRAALVVTMLALNRSGTRFEVELRFAAGQKYCCAEPGCFLPAYDRRWWQRLREKLSAYSDRSPPPMTITIQGVVENGAILELLNAARPSHSSDYTYTCGPLREQGAW